MPTLPGLELSFADPTMIAVLATCTVVLARALTMLHSPHDVISDALSSSGAARKKHVFVVTRHNLLRAVEKGDWERLTCGLGPFKLSAIAVSPAFARDQTLFVASFGGGVFSDRGTAAVPGWRATRV